MNPQEYSRMHDLETKYWWFAGRRAIVSSLLHAALSSRPPNASSALRLLDLGCGTGANLSMLCHAIAAEGSTPSGHVAALDYSPLALDFASQHSGELPVSLLRGDATILPFASNAFDIVTMLDVLEHVEDDAGAVKEIFRVLKPGGAFILSVPAYQKLWSAHDEALHHFRRYEYCDLRKVLRRGGFQVWRLSFAMSLMPPVAWFWRRFILPFKPNRPRDATRHSEGAVLPAVPSAFNAALVKYLECEGRVIRRRPLKFGTSLVAIARKPISEI